MLQRAATRERKEIARKYQDLGFRVYECHHDPSLPFTRANDPTNDWPNNHYFEINGIVIPCDRTFRELGHGGNYVCGEDFVLVSKEFEGLFTKRHRDHPGFRKAFEGRAVYFIDPYVMKLKKGSRLKTIDLGGHIDLTIGYVPRQRILTIADLHYAQIHAHIEGIARRDSLRVEKTTNDPPFSYHPFVNNYFVINPGLRDQVIVANRYEGFDRKLREWRANVRAPRIPITRLAIYLGSIKCTSNQAASTEVFDRLGISYRPWTSAAASAEP
jgi:hypothetical protein